MLTSPVVDELEEASNYTQFFKGYVDHNIEHLGLDIDHVMRRRRAYPGYLSIDAEAGGYSSPKSFPNIGLRVEIENNIPVFSFVHIQNPYNSANVHEFRKAMLMLTLCKVDI
jgi:hypothetical protein